MQHRNSFDALRLFAAALVVIGHSWPILGIMHEPSVGGVPINGIGCMMFFALSGYLITKSVRADTGPGRYLRFVRNHALRIIPALWVVVLVGAFVVGTVATRLPRIEYLTSFATWKYVVENMALWTQHKLPGVFQQNPYPHSVNTSLWTLPIEVTMYALTFPMVWIGRHMIGPVLLLSAAILMGIYFSFGSWFSFKMWSYDLYYALVYMPSYILGTIFACLGLNRISTRHCYTFALVAAMAIGAAAAFPSVYTGALLFVPIAAVTLFVGISPLLFSPLFSRIGDLSYGIYLWGFLVQQCLAQAGAGLLGPPLLATLALLISACLAWISWHAIEKQALRLKVHRGPTPRTDLVETPSPNAAAVRLPA